LGAIHDPRAAPEQYAAIHFHADDLYDAGWEPCLEYRVPHDLQTGVYACRLRVSDDEDYVPFFVLPARGGKTPDTAFLAATATYLAYANIRTLLERPEPFGVQTRNERKLVDHPEFGLSTYDRHLDGSGVHTSSPLRPLLTLRPKSWSWSLTSDMNIVAWLNRRGEAHDVITDDALHEEGLELLRRYRVVITGTHPEYYSTRMREALLAFLEQGGRLMYLGGNGFYWRIAYSEVWPGAIEVRRAEGGTRPWIAEPGEYHHAFTGEFGGLWRRIGCPPNELVGVGFSAQGFPRSTYFEKTAAAEDPRARFIFEGVSSQCFGAFGSNGGGAAGEELDRFDHHLGSPPHAIVLASSRDHPPEILRTIEEVTTTNSLFFNGQIRPDPLAHADMVFFETPNGGAVFSVGSIAWSGSLSYANYDNDVARITGNVLCRFKEPVPFLAP
jgi:N,N-dimethylformamidase